MNDGDATVLSSGRRRLYAREARAAASFFLLMALTTGATAQQPPTRLSLDEAIDLARKNNPDYQAQKNDAIVADWAVREAYGQLPVIRGRRPLEMNEPLEQVDDVEGRHLAGGEVLVLHRRLHETAEVLGRRFVPKECLGHSAADVCKAYSEEFLRICCGLYGLRRIRAIRRLALPPQMTYAKLRHVLPRVSPAEGAA